MKIISVRLKNINSLRGETFVDLEAPPLNETGLFAITGPTGSGKTTLLDAITLALYGQMHRNKKAEEGMSHGTGECLAAVEFLSGKKQYLAKWMLHRAYKRPEGKLQNPIRELAEWNEAKASYAIIAEKVKEVDAAIERITGLDYGRFTRSVLLAQGDFASFLEASPRNRSALLEQITGTHQYTLISKMAFRRFREEQQQLDNLENQLEGIPLLEEAQRSSLAAQREELVAHIRKLAAEMEKRKADLQWLNDRRRARQRVDEETLALERIKKEREKAAPDLHRLEAHRKTRPFRDRLRDLFDREAESRQLEKQIAEDEAQWEKAKKERGERLAALREKESARRKLEEEWEGVQEVLGKVTVLDASIQDKSKWLDELRNEKQSLAGKLADARERVRGKAAKRDRTRRELEEAREALGDQPADEKLASALGKLETLNERLNNEAQDRALQKERLASVTALAAERGERVARLRERVAQWSEDVAERTKSFTEALPTGFSADRSSALEEMQDRLADMGHAASTLDQLHQATEDYRLLVAREEELLSEMESLRAMELALQKEMLSQQDKLAELERELAGNQEIYDQQVRIANYEKDRQTLKEGEPCPLCQATHHPFRDKPLRPFVDRAEKNLARSKERLEKQRQVFRKTQEEAGRVFQRLTQLLGDEPGTAGGSLGELHQSMREKETRIRKHSLALTGLQAPVDRPKAFAEWLDRWNRSREELSERRHRLLGLHRALREREEELREARSELAREEASLEIAQKQVEEVTDRLRTLGRQEEKTRQEVSDTLAPLGVDQDPGDLAGSISSLRKRLEEEARLREKAQRLQEENISLTRQWEAHNKEVATLGAQLEATEKRLLSRGEELEGMRARRREWLGDEDPRRVRAQWQERLRVAEDELGQQRQQTEDLNVRIANLDTLLSTRRKDLDSTREACRQWKHELEPRIGAAGFQGLEEARLAVLGPREEQQLEALAKGLDERQAIHRNALAAARTDFEALQREARTSEGAESLSQHIRDLDAQLSEKNQEIGRVGEVLRKDREFRERHARLREDLEARRLECDRWGRLNELIGSADGKKFRVFAQGLTLKTLVTLANRHLRNLNDRYFIRRRGGQDLELDIIDTYQADNVRSMQTLSGGERFLVSLALALGLSDLSGHRHNIRSLFIDEGFGTLDKETLDLALTTLENLRASGKTIGIISHVEELKERISVQIQVRRLGNGQSAIRIVG